MSSHGPRKVPSSYKRTSCRLCLSQSLEKLFSLTPTPPAEWYFKGKNRKACSKSFPLELHKCKNCSHVQLLEVIDPAELFSNYFYETQTSPGLSEHFLRYASEVANVLDLSPKSLIIDVGSNDGTLLKNFRALGYRVIGIEPSVTLAAQCNSEAIHTYNSFLNDNVVQGILSDYGQVKLITANNVFAHNDDLRGMAKCVRELLEPEGFFIFEVSSLLHTMDGLVFDYIYHEHLSYHSLISLEPFLREFSLQIFDVEVISTKGGSYRVFAKRTEDQVTKSARLNVAIRNEKEAGISEKNFYDKAYKRITRQKEILLSYLLTLPDSYRMIGYGASATTTTLVYEFLLTDKLHYLVDDNPIRHGCYLPGTNIKVCPPEYIRQQEPEIVLILAWRFADRILLRLQTLLPTRTKIIIPLPEFRIIER